jgi:hypothetical protein
MANMPELLYLLQSLFPRVSFPPIAGIPQRTVSHTTVMPGNHDISLPTAINKKSEIILSTGGVQRQEIR